MLYVGRFKMFSGDYNAIEWFGGMRRQSTQPQYKVNAQTYTRTGASALRFILNIH